MPSTKSDISYSLVARDYIIIFEIDDIEASDYNFSQQTTRTMYTVMNVEPGDNNCITLESSGEKQQLDGGSIPGFQASTMQFVQWLESWDTDNT